MSTRGFIGFVADERQCIAYNHSSSYPDGIGIDNLHWLRAADLTAAEEAARNVRLVELGAKPVDVDMERLEKYYDPTVDGIDPETYERRTEPTWYQLLRGTMGNLARILDAGVMEDAFGQPYAIGSHYGYLVDFDAQTFEAYAGASRTPHADGRFASSNPDADGYYPARLVGSWPLSALPTDDEFFAAFGEAGA